MRDVTYRSTTESPSQDLQTCATCTRSSLVALASLLMWLSDTSLVSPAVGLSSSQRSREEQSLRSTFLVLSRCALPLCSLCAVQELLLGLHARSCVLVHAKSCFWYHSMSCFLDHAKSCVLHHSMSSVLDHAKSLLLVSCQQLRLGSCMIESESIKQQPSRSAFMVLLSCASFHALVCLRPLKLFQATTSGYIGCSIVQLAAKPGDAAVSAYLNVPLKHNNNRRPE